LDTLSRPAAASRSTFAYPICPFHQKYKSNLNHEIGPIGCFHFFDDVFGDFYESMLFNTLGVVNL
jgi:hypothetical protein